MPKQTNYIKTQIRIPRALSASIDEFASTNDLSKNESMLFLIMKGLEHVEIRDSVRNNHPDPARPIFEMIDRAIDASEREKIKGKD